jgi:3-hydroxybutyryl-CoA dehydrogenase
MEHIPEGGDIRHIAVVGAGFMGHAIGQEFALAGYSVALHDLTPEKLHAAVQGIERSLHQLSGWGLVPEEQVGPALGRVRTSVRLAEAVHDADLVIEAVFEDLELKQGIFRELDALCPPHTLLASNTSGLLPSLLAAATQRPDKVLVAHFFYPPSLLPLVEVVRGPQSGDAAVAAVVDLLKAMGKSPIVVQKEAYGFIANRLQFALQREALHIVEQGIASAQDVDVAVKDGFGRRLAVAGPFEIAEPIGWDLELRIQQYLLPHLANSPEPSRLLVDKVERGELGVKSGQGFYAWTPESAQAFRTRMAEALARTALLGTEG